MKFSSLEKATSRLYYFASGKSANHMRYQVEDLDFHLTDLRKALETLGEHTDTQMQDWTSMYAETEDSKALADLLIRYGSDKATKHNYHLIYASLLDRKRALNIFEIGLGTNNPDIPSNMGLDGKPGAAERAFRDWAPNSRIYGADVDKNILFSEDRIETFFVDQTDPQTLAEVASKLPRLDLIIDDGLHAPRANMNVINFALPLLGPDGTLVIEDIIPVFYPFWKIATALLSKKYDCKLVQMKTEVVAIIKNRV